MKSSGVKGFIIGGIAILCSTFIVKSETFIPTNIKLAAGIGLIIYGVLRLVREKQDRRQP